MAAPNDRLDRLLARFPGPGSVQWIGLRPRYRAPIESVQTAHAVAGFVLAGDHSGIRGGGKRQVTLDPGRASGRGGRDAEA